MVYSELWCDERGGLGKAEESKAEGVLIEERAIATEERPTEGLICRYSMSECGK